VIITLLQLMLMLDDMTGLLNLRSRRAAVAEKEPIAFSYAQNPLDTFPHRRESRQLVVDLLGKTGATDFGL